MLNVRQLTALLERYNARRYGICADATQEEWRAGMDWRAEWSLAISRRIQELVHAKRAARRGGGTGGTVKAR